MCLGVLRDRALLMSRAWLELLYDFASLGSMMAPTLGSHEISTLARSLTLRTSAILQHSEAEDHVHGSDSTSRASFFEIKPTREYLYIIDISFALLSFPRLFIHIGSALRAHTLAHVLRIQARRPSVS